MVAHRARQQFYAVADKIVLVSINVQRILAVQCIHSALRHRERIMRKFNSAGFFVFFIKRKIDNPAHFKRIFVNQAEFFADLVAQTAGKLVKLHALAGHKDNRIAVLSAGFFLKFLQLFGAQQFGNTLGAAGCTSDVGNAAHAFFLGISVKLVKERARLLAGAGNNHRLNNPALFGQIVINIYRRSQRIQHPFLLIPESPDTILVIMLVFIRPVTITVAPAYFLPYLLDVLLHTFVRLRPLVLLHRILIHRQRTQHLAHLVIGTLPGNLLFLLEFLLLLLHDFRFRHIQLNLHPALRIQLGNPHAN